MSKLKIEVSCVENSLYEAISDCKAILKAINATCIELKVLPKFSSNDIGHSWVRVIVDSKTEDLVKIYELEKKLKTLTP